MAILCNGEILPINVSVWVGGTLRKLVQFSPLPTLDGEPFCIKEHHSLAFQITPEQEGLFEICLEIESQQDMESFVVPLGVYTNIYSYGNKNEEFPFRPGYTRLKLKTGEKTYITRAEVIPIHYTAEQVRAIHEYMESQVQGICYDLINRKQLVDGLIPLGERWYQEYARYHQEKESEILSLLYKVEKEQLKKLVKEYRTEVIPKRTNAAGIRRTITKGAAHNVVFYNLKTVEVINEKLMVWLKFILTNWFEKIESALKEIEKELGFVSVYERELAISKVHIDRQREIINRDRNVAKILKDGINESEILYERKRKSYQTQRKARTSWQETLEKIRRYLLYLLRETELKETTLRFPKWSVQLPGPVLKQLRRLYEESLSMTRNKGKIQRLTAVAKPTWQVFEYFVTAKIMEAIARTNHGFVITRGLSSENVNDIIERGIPQGSKFELENERYRINVVYDELLPHYEHEAEIRNCDFYLANKHRRPDVRVELYEKQNEEDICKGIIVIEAKHRKFNDIYAKSTLKATQEQMEHYFGITYRKNARKRGRNNKQIVDDVYCIFSGDPKDQPSHEDKYLYIRLNPEVGEDGSIAHTQGFEKICEEIDGWLDGIIS